MSANTVVVKFNGVSFSYDGLPVFKDVSFTLFQHDFVCIVGPNGGGKTTLVKLMLGLLKPQGGSISMFGSPPEAARKRTGYMPQFLRFDQAFPINVMDIVLMGCLGHSITGFYSKADKRSAMEALQEMEIADLAKRPFASLSGGQGQRVLIARALACKPDLLLFDEPTAHVDPAMESHIYKILQRLASRMTVVTVTHELGFVSQIVERVMCVNKAVKIHPTSEITGKVIKDLYGADIKMVRHDHSCSEKGHTHD